MCTAYGTRSSPMNEREVVFSLEKSIVTRYLAEYNKKPKWMFKALAEHYNNDMVRAII